MKREHSYKLNIERGFVELAHGSGGRAMAQLIDDIFVNAFDNELLNQKEDNASFNVAEGRMVLATDSHVISPLFFPGGDIGSLSVHGTINDVAMSGAVPRYLTSSFILEEGFPLKDLQRIADSMAAAAKAANVSIITGDTKVVEKGKGDGVFINTTGLGTIPTGINISTRRVKAGDKILVSGTMGDHGITILSIRKDLDFHSTLQSDSAALHDLISTMVNAIPDKIHCLRDPTRGGLSATLNEIAKQADVGMHINDDAIPIKEEVRAACELLGLEPLHIANEGKVVVFCDADAAKDLLGIMRSHPLGKDAAIIGEVTEDPHNFVEVETAFGGKRILDWISGEQLPRIC
ncbi:hydrogenase expression/formation protein HypE [Pseudomonadota bacterium]